MAKWVDFKVLPRPRDHRTDVWQVITKEGGIVLGEIRWYSGWRRYAYYPAADTLYEEQCLLDIVTFMGKATRERREARARERLEINKDKLAEKTRARIDAGQVRYDFSPCSECTTPNKCRTATVGPVCEMKA